MRLLHTADIHLGLQKFGGSYDAAEDTAATLETFAAEAVQREVDWAIVAGDLFHSRRPGPGELYEAVKACVQMTHAGINVLITPGNHDGPATITDSSTHTLGWMEAMEIPRLYVALDPRVFSVDEVTFACMPYLHKRQFDIELADLPIEERVKAASHAAGQLVEAMADQALIEAQDRQGPAIFVGHVTMEGAVLGSERDMHVGWDVTLPPEALDAFDYAALGHIHRQQQYTRPAWYAGSPSYVSFSEESDPKGFLQAEVERGQPARVKPVPSHPRPIKVLNLPDDPFEIPPGAIVKLRLHGDWDPMAINNAMHAIRDMGAVYVGIEYVREERSAGFGADHIDVDFNSIDLLGEYLDAHKIPRQPAISRAMEIIDDE